MARIDNFGDKIHKFTVEDHSNGAIASAKVRREKSLMKAKMQEYLKMKDDDGIPYIDKICIGMIKGAIDKNVGGNVANYKAILETIGENQEEEVKEAPTINLNIIDNSNLEKVMYESRDK